MLLYVGPMSKSFSSDVLTINFTLIIWILSMKVKLTYSPSINWSFIDSCPFLWAKWTSGPDQILDIPDKHRKSEQHSGISEEYSSQNVPDHDMQCPDHILISQAISCWLFYHDPMFGSGPYIVSHAISRPTWLPEWAILFWTYMISQ